MLLELSIWRKGFALFYIILSLSFVGYITSSSSFTEWTAPSLPRLSLYSTRQQVPACLIDSTGNRMIRGSFTALWLSNVDRVAKSPIRDFLLHGKRKASFFAFLASWNVSAASVRGYDLLCDTLRKLCGAAF